MSNVLRVKREYGDSHDEVSTTNPLPVSVENFPVRRQKSYPFTGVAAISMTTTIAADFPNVKMEVLMVEALISTAPTTSESFTVTRKNTGGSANYDPVLYSVNPSAGATTSIVNTWDPPYPLDPNDEVVVAFTNTDARTIGGRLVVREVL